MLVINIYLVEENYKLNTSNFKQKYIHYANLPNGITYFKQAPLYQC